MKAWRAEEFGTIADVLTLQDVEIPQPPPGFVTIRVLAAGVALPDALMLKGNYPLVSKPPVSPGMEAAGEIVALGAGVAGLAIGDRIATITAAVLGWGGFAEYCLADASKAFPIPAGMSDAEAAGFTIPFKTAHVALVHRTQLKANETLLVLGAAGSSGAAAIQLGKALGARVIAVAGSVEKLNFCKNSGADELLDYRTADDIIAQIRKITDGEGVNVIFDPVGGPLATDMTQCMAPHGRFAIIGFASGGWVQLDPHHMVLNNYSAAGVFAGNLTDAESRQTIADLTKLAETGAIATKIGRTFAFDQVRDAIALQESGDFTGKLVVQVAT